MVSTSAKIALGYLLLIGMLFGSIGYIYKQMNLLTASSQAEESLNGRKKTTHQTIRRLYDAEIIGQTLRAGRLDEYPRYRKAMKETVASLDSLQQMLADTLQQNRIDTVRMLLRDKERNMVLVLEAMRESPTDELYRQQLDSLIAQQDSLLSTTHVKRRVVTHRNSYTIHHKPKKFLKRLANVFAPGKEDSTLVNNVVQEEYTDTIDETFNPVDTLASLITNIQDRVYQTRQERQRTLDARINRLRIAGNKLSQRVNQLLDTIEQEEQTATETKLAAEQHIRQQAARTMALIAVLATVLMLVCFMIVWRDITRSNHYRHELEKAKLRAENLMAAREKLMLTITHDIKAPTGSIIGYIDLLIRLVQDRRQQFYLHNMKDSARHLLNLVTSLLDYHRLESGKMELHPVTFNPHELFSNIHTSFLPTASQKGLQLFFDEALSPRLNLEGDPFRIRQIAENLLSNALKFTGKGSITLRTDYQGNRFVFSVVDTGCGMDQQEQTRAFLAFTRLKNAQGQEGFGLGLSITQKLVELLGGNIALESTPGKGSTFTVSLPLPSAGRKAETRKEEILPAGKTLRVLIIDDDRIQLSLTEAMIRNLFAATEPGTPPVVRCCEHPEQLLEALRTEEFDVMLTDIQMPAMNGFELLATLRAAPQEQARRIPVVAITARSDMDGQELCTKGFAGCLHKPFSQSELLEVLRPYIGNEAALSPKQTEPDTGTNDGYDFNALLAFSADDEEAAREIIATFAEETEKSRSRMEKALSEGNMKELCATAHKMLPTFTMIKAQEAVCALKWLESQRHEEALGEEARDKAQAVLDTSAHVLEQARRLTGKHLSSK